MIENREYCRYYLLGLKNVRYKTLTRAAEPKLEAELP
jgi:hypothetical protein